VLDLRDAEFCEFLRERRSDAAQRGHRPLFGDDAWRRIHRSHPRCTVHSISTRALRGRAATATVERAGKGSLKYCAMSSLTLAKFAKSVRKIVTFTTWAKVPPAAVNTALMFSNTRRASFSKSPSTICMVAGSSGICPARYTVSPTRTACEYGPMALGACSVWMALYMML